MSGSKSKEDPEGFYHSSEVAGRGDTAKSGYSVHEVTEIEPPTGTGGRDRRRGKVRCQAVTQLTHT